jgi:hypothetical protein
LKVVGVLRVSRAAHVCLTRDPSTAAVHFDIWMNPTFKPSVQVAPFPSWVENSVSNVVTNGRHEDGAFPKAGKFDQMQSAELTVLCVRICRRTMEMWCKGRVLSDL